MAASGWAVGDTASDERELTQLVNDLNAAIVKPDIAFLERVLAKDYVHYRPHGNVETRAQYPGGPQERERGFRFARRG